MPESGGRFGRAFWRDFGVSMAALAAGLFAAPPIRESLGWPDEMLRNIAITLPIMIIVHLALRRLFRPRA